MDACVCVCVRAMAVAYVCVRTCVCACMRAWVWNTAAQLRQHSNIIVKHSGILEKKLKWQSLKKRRRDSRLVLLFKGVKGAASIPTDDLILPIGRSRNHHSMTFQTLAARTDISKDSFFPHTIRDWNALPDSIITSVEGTEARFTSLVRARD